MNADIGFVILSHNDPVTLQRLVRRLSHSFDDPPIVCHHDSHQMPIDFTAFPSNARFVKNPVRTRWGHISLVQAFQIAMRQLCNWNPTQWITLLSANDYPIKPASAILSELWSSPFDAYLDYRCVPGYAELPRLQHPRFERHTKGEEWLTLAYNRYIATNVRYPGLNRRGKFCMRRLPFQHPRWIKPGPFDENFRCYAGDAWLTVRTRWADLLFPDSPLSRKLFDHYRDRLIPDESFFHTILCNSPGLRLCNDNKRYADWKAARPNPKWLGMDDLPALLNSTDHFARKFSESRDACVLDELDRLIERTPISQ